MMVYENLLITEVVPNGFRSNQIAIKEHSGYFHQNPIHSNSQNEFMIQF